MTEAVLVSDPLFPRSALVLSVDRQRPYDPRTEQVRWTLCRGGLPNGIFQEDARVLALTEISVSAIRSVSLSSKAPQETCAQFLTRLRRERPDLICLDGSVAAAFRSSPARTQLRNHLSMSGRSALFATPLRRPDDTRFYAPSIRYRKSRQAIKWQYEQLDQPMGRVKMFLVLAT